MFFLSSAFFYANVVLHSDILHLPTHRLTSRRPLWTDMEPVDIGNRWCEDWRMASVVNSF